MVYNLTVQHVHPWSPLFSSGRNCFMHFETIWTWIMVVSLDCHCWLFVTIRKWRAGKYLATDIINLACALCRHTSRRKCEPINMRHLRHVETRHMIWWEPQIIKSSNIVDMIVLRNCIKAKLIGRFKDCASFIYKKDEKITCRERSANRLCKLHCRNLESWAQSKRLRDWFILSLDSS